MKLTLTAALSMFAAGFSLILQMGNQNRVKMEYFTEVFSLTNPSNFGIQTTFRFQIQVYYQVNRPLNDLLTLQGGSTAQ